MVNCKLVNSKLYLVFLLLLAACSKGEEDVTGKIPAAAHGTFVDARDGHEYRWVRYGNTDWMAENMAFDLNNSDLCQAYIDYEAQSASAEQRAENGRKNVARFGFCYNLEGAQKACPDGWRLPTDEDWRKLEMMLGMSAEDAQSYGWRSNIASRMLSQLNDSCDINLQLGGFHTFHTTMGGQGYKFKNTFGYYWTSTPDTAKDGNYYFFRRFAYNSSAIDRQSMETALQQISVRYCRDVE